MLDTHGEMAEAQAKRRPPDGNPWASGRTEYADCLISAVRRKSIAAIDASAISRFQRYLPYGRAIHDSG